MKKKILISIVTATMVLGMAGCGSDGGSNIDDNITKPKAEDNKTQPIIIDRALKNEFVMPISGLETVSYGKGIAISKDTQTDDVYVSFKHDDKGKRVLFYIDADNNSDTGNSDYNGAELIVSGLQEKDQNIWTLKKEFWKSDESNQTKWIADVNGSKNDIFYNSGAKEDIVKFTHTLIPSIYFSVTSQVTDAAWNTISISDKVAFDIKMAQGNLLTITGDSSLSYSIENNATNISIKLLGNIDRYTDFTQIYIDSDDNTTTGFNTGLWQNLGADYMISGGKLYHRTADDWDYDNPKNVPSVKKADSINFDLKKSDFTATSLDRFIRVGVGVYATSNYYPATYAIPESNTSANVPSYDLN